MRVALVALLLTGCYAASPEQWTFAPTQETQVKADILDCKGRADAQRLYAASYGGAVLPIVSLFTAPGVFRECMAAKGYVGR